MTQCNGRVDIVKPGYVYADNTFFNVKIKEKRDSNNQIVEQTKTNLQFQLDHTLGINLQSVSVTPGTYNGGTKIWTIPTLTESDLATLTFVAVVTDDSQSPFNVSLELLNGDINTDLTDDIQIKYFGGLTQQDLVDNLPTVVGPPGPANTLAIGTVVDGVTASATITGTAPTQTLNLVLPEGPPGPPGADSVVAGPAGPPNTLTIGTVANGGVASATITGTAPNQTLNLVIPSGTNGTNGTNGINGTNGTNGANGANGPANVLIIGTVTEGPAAATITGTSPSQVLNLVIPQGDPGPPGSNAWVDIISKPIIYPNGNVSGSINLATAMATLDISAETIQDLMSPALVHAFHTNLTATYDDTNNRILFTSTSGGNTYTLIRVDDDLIFSQNGSPIATIPICCSTVPVHNHDDRYFTETEINGFLALKSNTGHTHVAADVTDFTTASRTAVTDNTAYGGSWDGVTNQSPSKNAVYDIVQTKANTSDLLTSDVTTTLTLSGTGITNPDNNNYAGSAGAGTIVLTLVIDDERGSGSNVEDLAYEIEYQAPFTYSSVVQTDLVYDRHRHYILLDPLSAGASATLALTLSKTGVSAGTHRFRIRKISDHTNTSSLENFKTINLVLS